MFFFATDCGAFHFMVKQSKKNDLVGLLGDCDEGTVIIQKHNEQLTLTRCRIAEVLSCHFYVCII